MNFFRRLLLLLFSLVISACLTKQSENSNRHQFDPRIPGGRIGGDREIEAVEDLEADTTTLGSIKLTWKLPSLYFSLPYKIAIYRKEGTAEFTLPSPANAYNSANLFKVKELNQSDCEQGNCSSWINGAGGDNPIVKKGITYRYWVFVSLNDSWSNGPEVRIKAAQGSVSLKVPSVDKFWENNKFNFGLKPNPPTTISPSGQSVTTFDMRISQESCAIRDSISGCNSVSGCEWDSLLSTCNRSSTIGSPKGDIAFGFGGGIAYIADTDNNRVVVYVKELAIACEQYREDAAIYQACLFTSQGGPYTSKNILGQPDRYKNWPCLPVCKTISLKSSCEAISGCAWSTNSGGSCSSIMPLDSCMTRPSGIFISEDKLFVSDSGNNRILVWDHIVGDPVRNDAGGCDPDISPLSSKEPDCSPSMQIGKKSLTDFANYNIATDGSKILKNPTGIVEKDGDLFISDTGHHRIVKVSQFANNQRFSCSEDNWNTSLCKFSAVLGQPSFEVSKTFNDFSIEDSGHKLACANLSNPRPGGALPSGSEAECIASSLGCSWSPLATPVRGVCSYGQSIFDESDIGSLLSPGSENLLRRYFANPTTIKITSDNKLLVLANENYTKVSIVGNPIKLNSRILIFNENPLFGENNRCKVGLFETGACDANDVIGQLEFRRLVSLQNSSSKYIDVIYGLEDLSDFDVNGPIMVAVDTKNNFVHLWNNWIEGSPGHPADGRVENPLGRKNPISPIDLPNLLGITNVTINNTTSMIYISAPDNHKVYEIQAY